MALYVPNWLRGPDLGPITIRYQVADAAGILGDGAGSLLTLTGVVDSLEYRGNKTREEISPFTSLYENPVTIAIDDAWTVVEIARATAALNFLPALKQNGVTGADYALLAFTRGTTNTFTAYGVMANCRESVRMGKSVFVMDLAFADVYDSTPTPDVPLANPAYGT